MNVRALTLLAATALLSTSLAGCLFFGDDAPAATDQGDDLSGLVGNDTRQDLEDRLSRTPKNYTFPEQEKLAWKTVYYNGSIGSEANTGYEDRNDRGGNSYNTPRVVNDVSSDIPPGQPTEVRITLAYANQPGSSVDLDIYVNLPGNQTDWATNNEDEMSWKWSVERRVVNTIGASGLPHEIGVQAANGRMLSGEVAYMLQVEYHYVKDVLTPHHPWAFQVPENASGIIVESEKAGGPEHIKSRFIVIGPDDELVTFQVFDDINVPTESVFIPVGGPGEYVFYAFYMDGGFLRLKADVGVPDRDVRPLETREERVALNSGPVPGLAERDWMHDGQVVTSGGGGEEVTFDLTDFPLRVTPYIGAEGGSSHTLQTDVTILAPSGNVVSSLQRAVRVDDERGSLGASNDHYNSEFRPSELATGQYTAQVVNNSPDAEVGYVVKTFIR